MSNPLKSLVPDLTENRIHVALFLVFLLLVIGYGWYFFSVESAFKRQMQALSEEYMRSISPMLGEKAQWTAFNRNVQRWSIPYLITDERGRPIHWRNIPEVRQTERLTEEALEILEKRRTAFQRMNGVVPVGSVRSGGPAYLMYFGRSLHTQSNPVFYGLYVLMVLALCATFVMWLRNRRLMSEATLWVGFAKETAHQFGTPVSSLLGWRDMLQTMVETAPDETLREKSEYIIKEMSDDIKKLKNNVLRFSQIGSAPQFEVHDLNEIVREAVAYFKDRLPQTDKHIQIIANYNPLPPLSMNRELVMWVMENLLKNSIDAIEKQEGRIEIETSYLEGEDKVRVTHSDNGKGIKSEIIHKIFDPGFTTKKRGWGLGLALCKRIISEIHKGRIFLESTRVDRGSTFVIELPAAASGIK